MEKEYELPLYLFGQGTNYKSYEFFGSHLCSYNGKKGAMFRVWAPHAKSVSVVGDFNNWDYNANVMTALDETGVWELFIEDLKEYDNYKYSIDCKKGRIVKSDPFAYHFETPSETASKLYDLEGYAWSDGEYRSKSRMTNVYSSPMNIYEVNLGSWKKYPDGNYYSYDDLARELVDYCVDMGYTHVEFMPITEFPFDGSWGYQVTGYFGVTSRYGTPKQFMNLVNAFHKKGIGVILDWVPAHFPKDAHGLYEFDGEPLYESSRWDLMEHKSWGTRRFDYGKTQVQSFLISSAHFFFEKYHIDGIRVDAVASMLYLDYDKKDGEWIPNKYGENKNLEAIDFLRKLNKSIFEQYPYALMIAEESTAWPMVTKPTDIGGLGFNFKWNMGWMNDILSYVKCDPYFRKFEHNKLTFSMMYAFSENYILPISHDEVVHGKASLINKMPGTYEEKFAGDRAFFGYMFTHPGKKLNFMGNEFGQFIEWRYAEGLEFFLLDYPMHAKLKEYTKTLNFLYKNTPAFYEIEDSWDGFEWLDANNKDLNTAAYIRRDKKGEEYICIICFSGVDTDYYLRLEKAKYSVVLDSDDVKFGGSGLNKRKRVYSTKKFGKETAILFKMPASSCLILKKIKA